MNTKSKGSNFFRSKMAARPPKPVVPLEDKNTPALLVELMHEALRSEDGTVNAIATELLSRFGQEPIRRLALRAADRNNSTNYRLRCLEVIRRIGVIEDGAVYSNIMFLTMDKNDEVRHAAQQVIMNLRMP